MHNGGISGCQFRKVERALLHLLLRKAAIDAEEERAILALKKYSNGTEHMRYLFLQNLVGEDTVNINAIPTVRNRTLPASYPP